MLHGFGKLIVKLQGHTQKLVVHVKERDLVVCMPKILFLGIHAEEHLSTWKSSTDVKDNLL